MIKLTNVVEKSHWEVAVIEALSFVFQSNGFLGITEFPLGKIAFYQFPYSS